jgi:tRNA1(Val) A37 N6-methylase TrmN6
MATADGLTSDGFLDGKVKLSQPAKGYRAGLDAVLLASSLAPPSNAAAIPLFFEAGCGAGAALLCAAARLPNVRLTGMEKDATTAALAQANAVENGLSDRVRVVQGDIARPPLDLDYGRYDVAFSNPPFFDDPRSLRAPSAARAAALITDRPFDQWARFMTRITKAGGYLYVIHRAEKLRDILTALDGRAGDIAVLPLHPRADEPAKRIIVRATKGARGPTRYLPSLILHDDGPDKHTPAVEAALRGESALAPLFDARP